MSIRYVVDSPRDCAACAIAVVLERWQSRTAKMPIVRHEDQETLRADADPDTEEAAHDFDGRRRRRRANASPSSIRGPPIRKRRKRRRLRHTEIKKASSFTVALRSPVRPRPRIISLAEIEEAQEIVLAFTNARPKRPSPTPERNSGSESWSAVAVTGRKEGHRRDYCA